MCATQKYAGKGSNATPAESTVAGATDNILWSSGRFSLEVTCGEPAEVLFWALSERRRVLMDDLRDCLLEKSPEAYLNTLEELEHIDDYLSELFLRLNKQLARVTTSRATSEQQKQAKQQRLDQLLSLPDWTA